MRLASSALCSSRRRARAPGCGVSHVRGRVALAAIGWGTGGGDAGVSISKTTRFAVLARDGFRCRYCGAEAPNVVLHVDHVIAKSRGGNDTEANLESKTADMLSSSGLTRLSVSSS